LGVIEAAGDGHITGFHEKNPDAPAIPGDPAHVYASMGNYVFSTRTLLRLLHDDAADETSSHDFGRDILPKIVGKAEIFAYDFQTSRIPGEPAEGMPYWRDVGTIDSYYEANMDLRSVTPALNLYNREWPLRTTAYPDPPAKFTFDEENRRGQAIDSIVSGGCLLSGGVVRNSVLGRSVRVHAGALVEDCVILDNCDIGRRSKIRRAILDKNVRVPEDAEIGYSLSRDRLIHHVTESGIVVIAGNRSRIEITNLMV
jgi:glucose-1-phosphate adenylyltransferase